jgi:membrane protease YdiL (CAAX protease family)
VGFVKRHPVPVYFGLAFAISWGGILALIGGPGRIPGTAEQVGALFPLVMLAWFAGPSLSSVLLTGLLNGRAGLRDLLARFLTWRVGARWYAVALLFAPLVVTAVLVPLSLLSPAFVPGIVSTQDKVSLLVMGIGAGLLGGGFMEELGWTGFAGPRLRQRYGVLGTGLIVGLLWGALHFILMVWAGGLLGFLLPLPFYVGALPAYRVLMVSVYDRTGSLLVAMLMHASLSASTLILQPVSTGVPVLTAVLWAVVGAVALAEGDRLSVRPLRPRVV